LGARLLAQFELLIARLPGRSVLNRALDERHDAFRMKSICNCIKQHLASDAQRYQQPGMYV